MKGSKPCNRQNKTRTKKAKTLTRAAPAALKNLLPAPAARTAASLPRLQAAPAAPAATRAKKAPVADKD
jgi:hypothetical protein